MNKLMLAAGIALTLSVGSAFAQFRYIEGRDYQPLKETIDNAQAPKVIEFFWYGCPHCYDLHEAVSQWREHDKPDAVTFEMVPAMPSARWEMGGHLYYTAKALGLDVDNKIFDEVHKAQNPSIIFDEDKAKSFLVSQGADKAAVEKAWDSFGVKQKIDRAKKLFDDSGLSGVPAFVVNGGYEVPYNGDNAEFFARLNGVAQSTQTQP